MTSEADTNNRSEVMDEFEFEGFESYGTEAYSYEGGKMEEEEISQEEVFSRLGESSDDPEQKRRYMEYLTLIKEIECQNQVIYQIKTQIMDMCAKPCKTRCEMKEIKHTRTCLEQENLKLQCLMNKAMQLQNFGSHRRYQEIPIATTIDEDNMEPYCSMMPTSGPCWKAGETSEVDKTCSCVDEQDDSKKQTRNLCQAMAKMKICCPEDKKLIQEIAQVLLSSRGGKKQHKDKKYQMDRNRCRQHGGIRKSKSMNLQLPCDCGIPGVDSLDKLKQKIIYMQTSVNALKQEICRREKEKQQCPHEARPPCHEEADPIQTCLGKRSARSEQMEKLKENYLYLLSEFAKKDLQLKEMEQRMKGFCGGCDGSGKANEMQNANEAELQLLRVRCSDMKEEQEEFKCLMKEQSQQLEDYRNKYLTAQQKVEEQSVTLDKLNMNNKRIEKQINTEVKDIRSKFQEKLNELLHFPKLLENEQLKLANVCKEKDELQAKLVLVCKELKSLKTQMESPKENTDCRPQLLKCQLELSQLKTKLSEAENQRDLFCDQLKCTQDDLDTLRSESAKIIARTKERAEAMRVQLQTNIDRLERELAQCRATACLSVSDREAVIREMQGQLNTLAYSFDSAQKQIKTLRNHVAYVSNENCFPIKC